ncbi:hypothetical protein [Actinophytocola sp. KF-1]
MNPHETKEHSTLSRSNAVAPVRPEKIKNLRYLLLRDRVLRFAEHAIGGWAPTLRAAFLMMAAFVGFVVLVGVVLGFGGALVGALVSGVALYLVGRSAASVR